MEYNVKAERHLGRNAGVLSPSSGGGGLNVLIVQSELGAAEFTAMSLRRLGHRVQLVGTSGRQCALLRPPDVVLMELALLGMDGCEFARWLQEPARNKKPFFIALADPERDSDGPGCPKVGIDLYLVKPLDNEFLGRVLERFRQIIEPPDARFQAETTCNTDQAVYTHHLTGKGGRS
jgi:DNA-binding response OmpR family regulator